MSKLVMMRHGQSTANQANLFTGWNDVDLTEQGVEQAHLTAAKILKSKLQFSNCHTSMLKRAIKTANIVLGDIDQAWIPLNKSWRLNERHYGALRGLNKQTVAADVGDEQVKQWRRGYAVVPPQLVKPDHERRYDQLGITEPTGESLEMALQRVLPYFNNQIAPQLLDGKNQLLISHGSTIRVLIKYLDQVADADIANIKVENGAALVYEYDDQLKIKSRTTL